MRVHVETVARGGQLYAVDLAVMEAANVVWTRYHRQLLTATEAEAALRLIRAAPVLVVSSLPLLERAFDVAIQNDIAVYDAMFVAAACDLGVGGVTADEPLVQRVSANHPDIQLLRSW
jgi:predicted nucleic acid-binding protein